MSTSFNKAANLLRTQWVLDAQVENMCGCGSITDDLLTMSRKIRLFVAHTLIQKLNSDLPELRVYTSEKELLKVSVEGDDFVITLFDISDGLDEDDAICTQTCPRIRISDYVTQIMDVLSNANKIEMWNGDKCVHSFTYPPKQE